MSDIPVKRNHMKIPWHNYVSARNSQPITEASLSEKASLIGRTGMMLLSCGTGAWRVRSSMNTLSEALGITCSADIGLMSISYTCFDGESSFSHALSLTTTGVNTSRLNRLDHLVSHFTEEGIQMRGEALLCLLDEIEAALDDSNVDRFANYLHKLTKNTQFIVITHRRGTMTAADRLYGITMLEKGVSALVSVNLIEKELDA